ncbi:MAG: hypothetical protein E7658_05005 [Ruminococcaceae bacterium]|nr:hypothetical protein [Oscillospiraceae bacterium]
MQHSPYYVKPTHPGVILSVLFMIAAAVIRTVYFALHPVHGLEWVIHYLFPVAAAVAFIAVVCFIGREVRLTCISVFLGVVFFILKANTFDTLIHTFLCVILYLTVLSTYALTLFGVIPTKKLLYPLFALPLFYHIVVEDTQYYFFADPPVPFVEWLPEISVLCIMAALLCVSFALTKKD